MIKHIARTTCLCVFFALFSAAASWSDDLFFPLWKAGDTWLVEAVYPVPFETDQWSEPVLWEYQVDDQGNTTSGDNVVLMVQRKDEMAAGPALRLVYSSRNHQLLKAEITKNRRGKKILKVLNYEGKYPVKTQQSPIPFDIPVFPIRIPSSLEFSFTKNISEGLKKTEVLRQKVRRVSGLPELKDVSGGSDLKELIEVRCEDIHGKELFLQYWDKTLPWPVYGRNLNMKYWLIKK